MSQLLVIPTGRWYLPGAGLTLRNNQTVFVYGESTGGSGYKFNTRGVASKLSCTGEVSGLSGSGTWTLDIIVYTDGVAAGNKVFELNFSGTVNGEIGRAHV